MFPKIRTFWRKYGFFIILGILLIIGIVNLIFSKEDGTYSTQVAYPTKTQLPPSPPQKRSPPTESKLESFTRKKLEEMFQRPFPKIRPDFLNNPVTGGKNNLEIDCYNDELKLAVEVQGAQHYKFIPYFHKSYEAFLNQKYRDELKRRMLKDNGIFLIEIPYNMKERDVEPFIRSEWRKRLGS